MDYDGRVDQAAAFSLFSGETEERPDSAGLGGC